MSVPRTLKTWSLSPRPTRPRTSRKHTCTHVHTPSHARFSFPTSSTSTWPLSSSSCAQCCCLVPEGGAFASSLGTAVLQPCSESCSPPWLPQVWVQMPSYWRVVPGPAVLNIMTHTSHRLLLLCHPCSAFIFPQSTSIFIWFWVSPL